MMMTIIIKSLFSNAIFLLLVISMSLTISISSNTLPASHQQAMAQKTTTTTNFLTYKNSTYGIKVQYPSNWLYKGSANIPTSTNRIQVQPIVTFVPALKTIHALVNIGTLNLPPIFRSIHIDNMSAIAPFIINGLKQSTPGFQLVESQPTNIGTSATSGSAAAIPAQKLVYTTGGPVYKVMTVFAIKGDKAFVIGYLTGSEAIYSSYLPIAQKMINSFQLTQ